VREAGQLAAEYFARRELLSIDRKGAQDLVSKADAACEDLIDRTPVEVHYGIRHSLRQQPESLRPTAGAIWLN